MLGVQADHSLLGSAKAGVAAAAEAIAGVEAERGMGGDPLFPISSRDTVWVSTPAAFGASRRGTEGTTQIQLLIPPMPCTGAANIDTGNAVARWKTAPAGTDPDGGTEATAGVGASTASEDGPEVPLHPIAVTGATRGLCQQSSELHRAVSRLVH